MTVFSNLEAARREGFHCYDFDRDFQLYIVVREDRRRDGARYRSLAYARPIQVEETELVS